MGFMKLKISIPFYSSVVQAGFPSPADDHVEENLDLNELLIRHPAATFFVRVEGDSMQKEIHSGDILIVDRSLTPRTGDIVIAALGGEFTVKRIKIEEDVVYLIPDNPNFKPIEVKEDETFEIFGVVTTIIHDARSHRL